MNNLYFMPDIKPDLHLLMEAISWLRLIYNNLRPNTRHATIAADAVTIPNPGVCFSWEGDGNASVDVEPGVMVAVVSGVEIVGACGSGGSPAPDPVVVLTVPRVILRNSAPLFRSDARMRCSITIDSVPALALALNSSTSPSLISFCSGAGFTI